MIGKRQSVATWRSSNASVCKTDMHGCKSHRGLIHERRDCPGGGTVYAEDLKSLTRKGLWVRIPPRAQLIKGHPLGCPFINLFCCGTRGRIPLLYFFFPLTTPLPCAFFSPGGFSIQYWYAACSSSSDSGFLFMTSMQSG
jgi:hypothetical protein